MPRYVVGRALFAVSLVTALVVAVLPGTTIAASNPTLRFSFAAPGDSPIVVSVSLRSLVTFEGGSLTVGESLEALAAARPNRVGVAPSVLDGTTVVAV